MPSTMSEIEIGTDVRSRRKRKRNDTVPLEAGRLKRRFVGKDSDPEIDIQSEMLLLENQILESRKHYNNIVTLLGFSRQNSAADRRDVVAAVALCRVFCRLISAGGLKESRDMSDEEVIIVQWLKERLADYEASTLVMLHSEDSGKSITALTLLMRLIREETEHSEIRGDAIWLRGTFSLVLLSLASNTVAHVSRAEFLTMYLCKYDDIRYYTFAVFA